MKKRSDEDQALQEKRDRIVGLGERSLRKSYYPQLRQRLRELERFRVLLDQTSEIIFVVRVPDGLVIDANRTALDLVRNPLQDAGPIHLSDLFRDDQLTGAWAALCGNTEASDPAASPGTGSFASLLRVHGEHEIPVEMTVRPAEVDREKFAVIVARDIRERIKAEETRKQLEDRLNRIQRLDAIGTLAGGIAHDFNNLLMAIRGNASLLEMETPTEDPRYEPLTAIGRAVESASDLTKQLLGLARGGKYEVQATDLNVIIVGSSAMFARTHKSITVKTTLADDLPVAEVDRRQIEQVLLNLFLNAERAMDGQGELVIETRDLLVGPDDTMEMGLPPGKYVVVAVTDDGCGMDQKTAQCIFDPFFTTQMKGVGTGLGLASVHGIIANHGGVVSVYSEVGEGSTFRVYLPAAEGRHQESAATADEIIPGTGTILLVDDEEMILEVGLRILCRLGYDVLTASSGSDAVQVLQQEGHRISAVVLDMVMPGKSGEETFCALRQVDPDIKIILASGYSANGKAQRILDRGADAFLQKPFSTAEISQVLSDALHDGVGD